MGLVHRQLGRYEEARAAFGKDLAWQRNDGTRDREARVRTALGHLESIAGNHPQALEAYAGALAVHKAIGDRAGIGASLLAMAQAYSSLGDYAQALPLLEEALEVQQSIQNRFDEWLIWNELGILHWLVGHFTEAENALRTGLAVSRAIESDFGAAYLLCNLGQVQRDAGQLHEGAATLRAALELALAQRDTALEATCHGDLALTLLALHEPAPALAEATLAEELFTQLEQDDALTAVFATQAHAYLALGNAEATLDAARRGIANLAAHGGDYFPHRDGFWCAQALAACGANDEARAAEETAAQALQVRAERISNAEMRSSYLNNIAVNRAIMQGLGESTQPVA
jgi:tetratricopeptide (TPR) repeat protein